MSRRHLAMLGLLAAIWGAAFMLIEIALRDLPPSSVAAGRIGFGALALAAYAAATRPGGMLGRLRAHALALAVAAAFNTAIPFVLIPWGQQYVDSGIAAILNASAPLFTVLLAAVAVRSQRVTGVRLAGFVVGFAGVALVVGAEPGGGGERAVAGSLAIVGAAALYAVGALFTGARLGGLSALEVALGTMAWATAMTLPFGAVAVAGEEVGWGPFAAVLALGVLATAFAYILYFELIRGAGASSAILVTYLVPALALVYGATILDEAVTALAVGGLALVLAGVSLGTGALGRRVAASLRT